MTFLEFRVLFGVTSDVAQGFGQGVLLRCSHVSNSSGTGLGFKLTDQPDETQDDWRDYEKSDDCVPASSFWKVHAQ